MAQTVEAFKSIKEPQAAFEAMKASAENSIALATQILKEVTALGFAQFHTSVDALQKAQPAPKAFASVGKGLNDAASTVKNALESAMQKVQRPSKPSPRRPAVPEPGMRLRSLESLPACDARCLDRPGSGQKTRLVRWVFSLR